MSVNICLEFHEYTVLKAKAAAFDEILTGYQAEEVDDMDSEWHQGSYYDNAVTRYLGIPTVCNGLDA